MVIKATALELPLAVHFWVKPVKPDGKILNIATSEMSLVREAPIKFMSLHCPNGGEGGLNACPDGWGTFFREEFSKFKRAFA